MVPPVFRGESTIVRVAILVAAAGLGLGSLPARAEIRLDTVNTIACAEEGGICRMPYPTNVYFGVPGKTHGRPFPQGGTIPCNVQSFGDPAPGQRKACWYAPRITGNGGGGYRDQGRYRGDDRYDDRSRGDDRYRDDYRARRDEYRPRRDDYDRPRRDDYDYVPERRRYRSVPDDE